MDDPYLCVMAICIVAAYGIYMIFNPHTNGLVFGSVVGAVCVLAGVQYQKKKQLIV